MHTFQRPDQAVHASQSDRATLVRIRKILDWIAGLPKIGAPLRGGMRKEFRARLELYAIERLAKIPPGDRRGSHAFIDRDYYRFATLEADLIERVKALRISGTPVQGEGAVTADKSLIRVPPEPVIPQGAGQVVPAPGSGRRAAHGGTYWGTPGFDRLHSVGGLRRGAASRGTSTGCQGLEVLRAPDDVSIRPDREGRICSETVRRHSRTGTCRAPKGALVARRSRAQAPPQPGGSLVEPEPITDSSARAWPPHAGDSPWSC